MVINQNDDDVNQDDTCMYVYFSNYIDLINRLPIPIIRFIHSKITYNTTTDNTYPYNPVPLCA